MKVLIAGGGGGGHFYSGVAVAEAILARAPDASVVYVGTADGMEVDVARREGLDLRLIDADGWAGKEPAERLRALLRLPRVIWQAFKLLRRERPRLVVGVGGYAAGPVVLMASLLGRRTAIIEQNSVAGFTNRLLGHFVHRVFLGFEAAAAGFPRRVVRFTGNPIREGVVNLLTLESTATVGVGSLTKVLVVGGTHGARTLNEVVPAALRLLDEEQRKKFYLVHQSGPGRDGPVRAAYEELGVAHRVEEFIDPIAEAYRASDLVVCRAGALTCSELTISQRAAILVPFPHAADNHQEHNARSLVEARAAILILERDLNPKRLADELQALNRKRRRLQEMAWNARALARPQAATEVVDELFQLIGRP